MSKFLIDEQPLTVQPSLAKVFGLEKAIILQQLHYGLQQPKSGKVLSDGFKYIWNTYKEWQSDYFSWLSVEMIRKYFTQLEQLGILISQQPFQSKGDSTKYYRIDYEKVEELVEVAGVDDLTAGVDDLTASLKGTKISYKEQTPTTALPIYREFFPNYRLAPYQENLLADTQVNPTDFRAAMRFWAARGYRESNIGDLLNCYETKSYLRTEKNKPNEKRVAPMRTGLLSDQLAPYTPPKRRMD